MSTIEKHEPPAWVVHRITQAGGLNRYGKPNFRVIWGGNRFHTVGGMFKVVKLGVVTQVADVRQVLAYNPHRWHMERWIAPEVYGSPEEWYALTWNEEAQVHGMGDYPTMGEYEHVFYLAQCPHMKADDEEWCIQCKASDGEFIPLEENVHILEQQIRMLLMSQGVSSQAERFALFLREDLKRQVNRKRIGARVQEAMRPQLALQPTSWQPGTGGKTSVPEAQLARHLRLPVNRRGFHQSSEEPTKEN